MRWRHEAVLSFGDTALLLDLFGASRTLEGHDSRNKDGSILDCMLIIIHRGYEIQGEVKNGAVEKLVGHLLLFLFVRDFNVSFQDNLTGLS